MTGIPKPKKTPIYRRWWLWAVAVLTLLTIIAAVAGQRSYKQKQIDSYAYLQEGVSVERRDLKRTITTTGLVSPEQVTLLSPAAGTITELNVASGDEVSKDDLLMKVDVSGRVQEFKAPFDGRIISVSGFEGGTVTPGMTGIEVGYRSSVVSFLASDSEVIDLEVGQPVTMTVPSLDNGKKKYQGEVKTVGVKKQIISAGNGQAETGYPVTVSGDNLPSRIQELVGAGVDLEITTSEKENVIAVLSGAIQYDDNDDPFVYRVPTINDAFIASAAAVEEIGTLLEDVAVSTGFEGDEYIEITSGVRDGDEVLLYVPSAENSSSL